MARPVFVIGRIRSGTKWLSNRLSTHPDVVSIRHPKARGICETNLISRYERVFGDLRIHENRRAWLAAFFRSTFFLLSELDERRTFFEAPDDYLGTMRYVLDGVAEREGCGVWLQKASSLELPQLTEHFPDATFVIIQRENVEDNVRSSFAKHIQDRELHRGGALSRRQRLVQIAFAVFSFHLHNKIERRYLGRPGVLRVSFEELKRDERGELDRLVAALELGGELPPIVQEYEQNTSYRAMRKEDVFRSSERAWLRLLDRIAAALPLRVHLALQRVAENELEGKRKLLRGTFSLWEARLKETEEASSGEGARENAGAGVPASAGTD